MKRTVLETIQYNRGLIARRGPGLFYGTALYVIARNPQYGKILLGGFGPFTVGEMWVDEQPFHKELSGYEEAEITHAVGGFGWPVF